MNILREQESLPKLIYKEEAMDYARIHLDKWLLNQSHPPIPNQLGETRVFSLSTLQTTSIDEFIKECLRPSYYFSGVSIKMARNEEYPGGAYFISLLLGIRGSRSTKQEGELINLVLTELNCIRKENNVSLLSSSGSLDIIAKKLARSMPLQKRNQLSLMSLSSFEQS